jgi:hypothetical protein
MRVRNRRRPHFADQNATGCSRKVFLRPGADVSRFAGARRHAPNKGPFLRLFFTSTRARTGTLRALSFG